MKFLTSIISMTNWKMEDRDHYTHRWRGTDESVFIKKAASTLSVNGVVILNGLYKSEEANSLLAFYERYLKANSQNELVKHQEIDDAGSLKVETHSAPGQWDRLHSEMIQKIIKKAGAKIVKPNNLQLHIDKSNTEERALHFGTNGKEPQVNLYLSDVMTPDDGPLCYVPGSQQRFFCRLIIKFLNKCFLKSNLISDATAYEDQMAFKILGEKGTVIISFQNGVHRFWPQSEGHKRVALVQTFN